MLEAMSDSKDRESAMETKTCHNDRLNAARRCCFSDTLQMLVVGSLSLPRNDLVKEGH
jgi:hypothetical protein